MPDVQNALALYPRSVSILRRLLDYFLQGYQTFARELSATGASPLEGRADADP